MDELANESKAPRDLPAYMYTTHEATKRRRDSLAMPALLCGIGGVFVALTSIPAIVLGVVSLRRTRREQTSGTLVALAAVALGIVGVAVWSVHPRPVRRSCLHQAAHR